MKILRSKNVLSLVLMAVFCLMFSLQSSTFAALSKKGPVDISFTAKDGFNLTGSLYISPKGSIKRKLPFVVLLHPLGGSRLDWGNIPVKLKNQGYAVLAMDLRGHGYSITNKKGKRKYWQNFDNKEFQKYPTDIIYAINYVRQQYPEINTHKTAIIASDLSANVAVIAANSNKNAVKTLVLFSPMGAYKGIDARIPLVGYGKHPVLIVVSKRDRASFYSSYELIKYAQGVKLLKAYPNGGNGLDLLKSHPDAQKLMYNWLGSKFAK